MQQSCEHVRWRVDGAAADGIYDVLARINNIEGVEDLEQFDPSQQFNRTMGELQGKLGKGYKLSAEEFSWLKKIYEDFQEILKDIAEKQKVAYSKELHTTRLQVEDKAEKLKGLLEYVAAHAGPAHAG